MSGGGELVLPSLPDNAYTHTHTHTHKDKMSSMAKRREIVHKDTDKGVCVRQQQQQVGLKSERGLSSQPHTCTRFVLLLGSRARRAKVSVAKLLFLPLFFPSHTHTYIHIY